MATYVTLAELKAQIGITDTDRDAILTAKLESASRQIEDHCGGRVFTLAVSPTARTWPVRGRLVRDRQGETLLVDDIGDTTDLTVEVGWGTSWTLVDPALYSTTPANALARGWPVTGLRVDYGTWGVDWVRVTARWGWPSVPQAVIEATVLQAARLYKRKDSPEGVTGSAEWGSIRVSRIDPDVAALLTRYTDAGIA